MLTLTEEDLQQIKAKGISLEIIGQQLESFRTGIPYTTLDRPCTIDDGIIKFSSEDLAHYADVFQKTMDSGRATKFVPASGAATRMFKTLLSFLEQIPEQKAGTTFQELLCRTKDAATLKQFFLQLESFAFYRDLKTQLEAQEVGICNTNTISHGRALLETLLFSPGLNYSKLPKGLLKFHQYTDHSRTPIEEHIIEGSAYVRDSSGSVRIHFTVSPEHEQLIQQHLSQILDRIESQDIQLDITFSHQQSSTDTLAVDLENRPFRDSSGQLVFRPGGHGALLNNLHALQGDIVFIKNIDNVVPERLTDQPNLYKKALGGYLITVQNQLFSYMETLSSEHVQEKMLNTIYQYAQETLGITIPKDLHTQSVEEQREFLIERLNRPLRVCGMVPNTGEPGGGPFWVIHQDDSRSLQIVESSQVDPDITEQQAILKTSTHFNPVDLVCGVRDYQGKAFDLPNFSDPNTGFISMKSYQGRDLKALELPGLWNGAMASWNTVFVEVPAPTFNPVKTVFDLLRPEHQPA